MQTKVCTKCGIEKDVEEFQKRSGNLRRNDCKDCSNAYYRNRRATVPHFKQQMKDSNKESRRKLRRLVLSAYGNRCVCCGESTYEFLAIDHIHNDGAAHRREIYGENANPGDAFYRWLRDNNFPKDNFQILCHNCNLAKGFYGCCPHKQLTTDSIPHS